MIIENKEKLGKVRANLGRSFNFKPYSSNSKLNSNFKPNAKDYNSKVRGSNLKLQI